MCSVGLPGADLLGFIAFVPQTDCTVVINDACLCHGVCIRGFVGGHLLFYRGVVINDACLGHIASAFVDLCVDINIFLHTNTLPKNESVCGYIERQINSESVSNKKPSHYSG